MGAFPSHQVRDDGTASPPQTIAPSGGGSSKRPEHSKSAENNYQALKASSSADLYNEQDIAGNNHQTLDRDGSDPKTQAATEAAPDMAMSWQVISAPKKQ